MGLCNPPDDFYCIHHPFNSFLISFENHIQRIYHKDCYVTLSIVGGTVQGAGGQGRGSAADTGGPSSD